MTIRAEDGLKNFATLLVILYGVMPWFFGRPGFWTGSLDPIAAWLTVMGAFWFLLPWFDQHK